MSRALFPIGKNFIGMLFLAAAFTSCAPAEDTRPGQPVAHRQAAFKAIMEEFEPMGAALRRGDFPSDEFLKRAERLFALKDDPWPYFGADTQYPPSKAEDRLWREPEIFAARRDDFLKAAESLRAAAKQRDEKSAREAWKTVEESCRACHKTYKRR
ncbi:MAG: cytochrome c [Zoogloeaceae bacterium]|jgi:cytochrome c556|nr:cytochrome c [Zoogloeaceae bacterium]